MTFTMDQEGAYASKRLTAISECDCAGTKFLILVSRIRNEKNESRMVFEKMFLRTSKF